MLPRRLHMSSLVRLALLASCVAAVVTGIGPAVSTGATASTVVNVVVPSAVSLSSSCHDRDAWSLGTVLPGSPATTSTGADVCRFTWSSSNSSSMLRIHQTDRAGAAMVGQTATYSALGPNSGAPYRFDGRGAVYLGAHEWMAGPMRRSIDTGATFANLAQPGNYWSVSMTDASTAWRAGSSGVQRTLDASAATPTWTSTPTAVPAGGGDPSEIDALSSTVAWVSKNDRAYLTTDGGSTWVTKIGILSNSDNIEAASSTTAFVTGWAGALSRTTDGNVTWAVSMTGIAAHAGGGNVDVSVAPGTPTTVWFVNSNGVYRSTNTGTNWSATTALPDYLKPFMIRAVSATEAYVGGYDGIIYRTTDSGTTWNRFMTPLSGPVTSIVVLGGNDVLVGEASGHTFATNDGGATWNVVIDNRGSVGDIDAVDRGNMVAADAFGRVRITTDNGATWVTRSTTIAPWPVRGVAMDGSGNANGTELVLAVGDGGRISQSWDGGATWTARPSGTAQDLWDTDVAADGTAIAVGAGGVILRSTDFGSSWSSVGGAAATLRRVDIHDDGTVLAVGHGGLIRRSVNGGLAWTTPASGTSVHLLAVTRPSDEVAYASGERGLVRSTDGGATWSVVAAVSAFDSTIVVAPTDDTVWLFEKWVGGWTGSWARRSTDGGQTWSSPLGGAAAVVGTALAFDTGRIIMGGTGGTMRMTNPAPEITDYAAGTWAGGTARFGVCLQALGGAAAVASFAVDANASCIIDDAEPWNAVPIAPTKIGQMAAPGTGSADLVWGMRAGNATAPGQYTTGVTITAVAPNA